MVFRMCGLAIDSVQYLLSFIFDAELLDDYSLLCYVYSEDPSLPKS